ncbi:fatty acid cis/trans isomerase [Pseudomonas sp. StFLB209]|uniref:fatty acid cis/trans isomerase n=1 Tax=Pseudomonas sp. StFLB209 TaxID=1028989 RepID=UPI0005EE606D|nr:fatty acid cis/trans isomerase [Pseudomonas sp. StFLB209]
MPYRLLAGLALLLSCCTLQARDLPAPAASPVSYTRDIQPILTDKCVACHACNDAPCQLNLGSGEGVLRGANKVPVYQGERSRAVDPTRLFYDANGTAAWQRKGFYSVLEPHGGQAALMTRMLELGQQKPLPLNSKIPDDIVLGLNRENLCPSPEEFNGYAGAHPTQGMPLAVTGLTATEHQTLQRWLAAGAPIDQQPLQANAVEAAQIKEWEALLNRPGASQALVGRWLYEHLFLAHIYFDNGDPGHFFQWVRSRTPSGKPVDIIATRRPNDDPGRTEFYYRLVPVQGVIVHKTHITYALSAQKLKRVQELFYNNDWHASAVPGYGPGHRANPFLTFEAIPARARYQFMLDNAQYFVNSFIRGPVCRGQIATDVIRDHFWVLFQEPASDLYVDDARYQGQATPLLAMPGQNDDVGSVLSLWLSYKDRRNDYENLRRDHYADAPPADWSTLWKGNDNALLTVFRHFDSATVSKGLIGDVPKSTWLFDYPLLERTYYQLVVNFDVYGNIAHQAQTRLYFDLIRNGAEINFLRLMPANRREALLSDLYQDSGKIKMWLDYQRIDDDTPSRLQLDEKHTVRDFARQLIQRMGPLNAAADPINRCPASGACVRAGLAPQLAHAEQVLSRLAAKPAGQLKVIEWMPEATMLRVADSSGQREVYSVLRNRAHSNVAFLLGESYRYQPRLDTLTVYPGVLSSYPNFMFNVPAGEVEAFVEAMRQVSDQPGFERLVERWGVRRTHPQFWSLFHDLSRYIQEHDPREFGVLDMNRYENL